MAAEDFNFAFAPAPRASAFATARYAVDLAAALALVALPALPAAVLADILTQTIAFGTAAAS